MRQETVKRLHMKSLFWDGHYLLIIDFSVYPLAGYVTFKGRMAEYIITHRPLGTTREPAMKTHCEWFAGCAN